jgi:hypothetical protein
MMNVSTAKCEAWPQDQASIGRRNASAEETWQNKKNPIMLPYRGKVFSDVAIHRVARSWSVRNKDAKA